MFSTTWTRWLDQRDHQYYLGPRHRPTHVSEASLFKFLCDFQGLDLEICAVWELIWLTCWNVADNSRLPVDILLSALWRTVDLNIAASTLCCKLCEEHFAASTLCWQLCEELQTYILLTYILLPTLWSTVDQQLAANFVKNCGVPRWWSGEAIAVLSQQGGWQKLPFSSQAAQPRECMVAETVR